MVERWRPPPERAKPKHVYLTDAAIRNLRPKRKQYLIWDAWPDDGKRQRGPDPARGLCVLISPKGTKAFRACYYFPGSPKPHYLHLGRVGELSLAEARRRCNEARRSAGEGRDPKAGDPARSGTFATLFNEWVEREQVGRRKNKSARLTQSFVLKSCPALLTRPVAAIRYAEIEALLEHMRDGDGDKLRARPAAAIRLAAHLRGFFHWCARHGGPLDKSPMQGMPPPALPTQRNRVYSDDELRAIWHAAEHLDPSEGSYVKLIMLLALRREELAQAKWGEFDNAETPMLLTIPFERTKGKSTRKPIVYRTPLPGLAQRIIRSLPHHDAVKVFKRFDFERLKSALVDHGAPPDFKLHVMRHTVATWLENAGHSPWERGLVLNHADSSVAADYSHGFALERKRELMTQWADHVEGLIRPSSAVTVLR